MVSVVKEYLQEIGTTETGVLEEALIRREIANVESYTLLLEAALKNTEPTAKLLFAQKRLKLYQAFQIHSIPLADFCMRLPLQSLITDVCLSLLKSNASHSMIQDFISALFTTCDVEVAAYYPLDHLPLEYLDTYFVL